MNSDHDQWMGVRDTLSEKGDTRLGGYPIVHTLMYIYMRKFKQSSFGKTKMFKFLRSKQASVSAYMYQGFLINIFQSYNAYTMYTLTNKKQIWHA